MKITEDLFSEIHYLRNKTQVPDKRFTGIGRVSSEVEESESRRNGNGRPEREEVEGEPNPVILVGVQDREKRLGEQVAIVVVMMMGRRPEGDETESDNNGGIDVSASSSSSSARAGSWVPWAATSADGQRLTTTGSVSVPSKAWFIRDAMPSMSEFDYLIKEGSSESGNSAIKKSTSNGFPDKHFDLETILRAELRPVFIKPERSPSLGSSCR
ncbi:hypothetical protein NE237_006981 [Protea cynaroides]|uniref:Uncharacterized protein n=1 Tax=Protea cynaroides TaxID=273540 RepID=A0A9Q0KND0_9MAGN|nr:hypothetical protein NE237_006981 [Protea cynaroides]